MDFNNFGVISYTAKAKISPFIDYLFQDKFMTTRCIHCQRVFFPPQSDCPYCLSADMEWFEIKDEGTLLSYSTAMYGPAGFENKVPYTLGIVQFKDNIKVLASIAKEINPKTLKVGMKFKVKPVMLSDQKVSYEFILAGETNS
jgi:uncharacterized protein